MPATPGKWRQIAWFDGKACIVVGEPEVKCVIAKVEDLVGSCDANLICAAPVAYDVLDEIRQALEQTNGRETSYTTRREMAPALARIREYFKQVDGSKNRVTRCKTCGGPMNELDRGICDRCCMNRLADTESLCTECGRDNPVPCDVCGKCGRCCQCVVDEPAT